MNTAMFLRFWRLITPSLSSATVCFVIGLFIAGYAFLSSAYVGSYENIQMNMIAYGEFSDNKLIAAYQTAYFYIVDTKVLGVLALFAFWSLVGMASYLTVAGIVNGIRGLNEFKEETEYIHIDKAALLRETGIKIGIRVVGLIVFFVALQFMIRQVIPWGRDIARVGANEIEYSFKLAYSLSAITIVGFWSHVMVVLARITALKVRVFGGEDIPEEAEATE